MYYKLVDKTVVRIKGDPDKVALEWEQQFSSKDRFIEKTDIGTLRVSTVFLGIDHSWDASNPELFETMIFEDGKAQEDLGVWRCSTYEEAQAQHRAVVAKLMLNKAKSSTGFL